MKIDDTLLELHLREFAALHAQILERSRVQQSLLAVAATLSTAVIALIGAQVLAPDFAGRFRLPLAYALCLSPFPFYGIGLLHGHADRMIATTAEYLDASLRSDIATLLRPQATGGAAPSFWRNEDYFRETRSRFGHTLSKCFAVFILVYFVPSVLVCISSGYSLAGRSSISAVHGYLLLTLHVMSGLILVLSVVSLFGGERAVRNIVEARRHRLITTQ